MTIRRCSVVWMVLVELLLLVLGCALPLCSSLPSIAPRISHFVARDPLTWSYARQWRSPSSSPLSSPPLSAESIAAASAYNWTTLYYTGQRVDHFGWRETALFTQKYLVNADHWRPPSDPRGAGPLFLYAGNEGQRTAR